MLGGLTHGLWECGECGLVDERGFDDDHWVRQAHRVRDERARRPSQSKFRVVAVVVYERGDGTVSHVIGHNDEAACLKNSICAERAAFVQLCMLPQSACSRVTAVYIASDAAEPITPGALCREFMMSSPLTSTDTRIVMEGGGRRLDLLLAGLYPHASPYIRLTAEEQAAAGRRLGPAVRPFPAAHEQQAWEGAVAAAQRDARPLHAIGYGACVVFEDGSDARAWQWKALEYSCSLDAVCLLAPALAARRDGGVEPRVLCLADQHGVCHAPHATARAILVEHGYGDVRVLVHDSDGHAHTPTAAELLPTAPTAFDAFLACGGGAGEA